MNGNLVLFNGRLLDRVQDEFAEMEKTFNELFSDSGSLLGFNSGFPKCNVMEFGDRFLIEMAIAGFGKKDVEIKISDNEMKVSGVKKVQHADAKYHVKELANRAFAKTISIPKSVDVEKIEAIFEDGVLKILLPKLEEKKTTTKVIEIK